MEKDKAGKGLLKKGQERPPAQVTLEQRRGVVRELVLWECGRSPFQEGQGPGSLVY